MARETYTAMNKTLRLLTLAAVALALFSSVGCDKLKARGLEQAGKFSWDASVRRMLQVYREVAQT